MGESEQRPQELGPRLDRGNRKARHQQVIDEHTNPRRHGWNAACLDGDTGKEAFQWRVDTV
jgi:hypothetical protein